MPFYDKKEQKTKNCPGEPRQLEFTDWFRPRRREFQWKALSGGGHTKRRATIGRSHGNGIPHSQRCHRFIFTACPVAHIQTIAGCAPVRSMANWGWFKQLGSSCLVAPLATNVDLWNPIVGRLLVCPIVYLHWPESSNGKNRSTFGKL